MNRKLLSAITAMALAGPASVVSAQTGTIMMTSTGYPDSVVIDITITDPGGGPPGCSWLAVINAEASEVLTIVERAPNMTTTLHFVDTEVVPNTVYCYRMALLAAPVPAPIWCGGDPGSLCEAFDCFYDIQTCSNTGPDPAVIGHGFLTSEGAVPNEVAAFIASCDPMVSPIALYSVAGTAQQYLDGGTAVDVFGTMERGNLPQGVWYWVAQAATPHSCTIAVERRSWGAVKALYKD